MDSLPFMARIGRALALACVLALAACATAGPPMTGGRSAAVPTRTVEVLYVTDRARIAAPDGSLSYGSERSKVMSFGSVVLADDGRGTSDSFSVERVTEVGAFPATP